eukprot:m.92750 g.92750  ORF g.92750 m.92750 type:complete len:349 (-) comp18288_c0_seq1:38-1084(-)
MPAKVCVTGATGYIASHIVQQLLLDPAQYIVHATARDPTDEEKVGFLKKIAADANASDRLRFFKADLLEDGSFDEAVKDCTYVLHTASPFILNPKGDLKKVLVEPAVNGVENVLNACSKSPSVKRVVQTSSVVAIMGNADDKNGEPFSEEDWNHTSTLKEGAYSYSKRLAEEKARDMAAAQSQYSIVHINPGLVVGPTLSGRADSASCSLVSNLAGGKMRFGAPALPMALVDVRDIAKMHILAMANEKAKGRYLCVSRDSNMVEMGTMLQEKYGAYPLPTSALPTFLVYLVGPFDGFSWHYISHNLGHDLRTDTSKVHKDFDIEFIDAKKSLEDMMESLIEHGMLPRK